MYKPKPKPEPKPKPIEFDIVKIIRNDPFFFFI